MGKKKVGVLGATGAVGQRICHMLRDHSWYEVTELTAGPSAGKAYGEAVSSLLPDGVPEKLKGLIVKPSTPTGMDVDFVFSALPSNVAMEVEPEFAKSGIPVVSNASAFRMEADVPLVVPEVNPDHIELIGHQRKSREWEGFIATDPNCSTISLVIVLKPLQRILTMKKVFVTTMPAISPAATPASHPWTSWRT